MKTQFKTLITACLCVSFFAITGFSGCDGANTEPNPTQTETEDISILFNENKTVLISENSVDITFTEVEDSRVPLSECAMSYGSRANVKIALSGVTVLLQIFGCNTDNQGNILDNTEYIDTLGYRINAYRLEPYPSGNPVNQSDYVLKIKISKL